MISQQKQQEMGNPLLGISVCDFAPVPCVRSNISYRQVPVLTDYSRSTLYHVWVHMTHAGTTIPGLSASWEVKEKDMPQTHRLNKYLTLFFWARSEKASVKDWWTSGKDKKDKKTHNWGLGRPFQGPRPQQNVPSRFFDSHQQWFLWKSTAEVYILPARSNFQ